MVKKIMTFMNWLKSRWVPSIALFVVLMASAPNIYADWAVVELRADLSTVTEQPYMDYKHSIYAPPLPSLTNPVSNPIGTKLGVKIPDANNFAEIGYKVSNDGVTTGGIIQWYVYAKGNGYTLDCWQGTPAYLNGVTIACTGVVGDNRATFNSWLDVEVVTYTGQPWWILRVYDQNGVATDVAKFNQPSKDVNSVSIQTFMPSGAAGRFYHLNPRQKTSYAPVNFQTWPASSGGHNNYLDTFLNCPVVLGNTINLGGLGYYWSSWTGGTTCSANPLF